MSEQRNNIILVGMMGTGKTTVGAVLAEMAGYRLIDLDKRIEEETKCTIPELFANQGEQYFRDIESTLLRSVLQEGEVVLATGGGAVLREENRSVMLENGWVVALTADLESILKRVGEDPGRPLLAGGARERVTVLLEERKHAYDFAQAIFDTSGKNPDILASEILMRYRGQSK
ncbi:shikimate kinase [Paenibacillus bouchesdurhonensis]|uniref:shikimate kinase n=1 Tax=Paenibacillus bouchesdurhonensis TaxID=1870990 RepID=UPI000FB51FC0|nr:shikimate kinase [Paenibacillus bouchesdurhonensis]